MAGILLLKLQNHSPYCYYGDFARKEKSAVITNFFVSLSDSPLLLPVLWDWHPPTLLDSCKNKNNNSNLTTPFARVLLAGFNLGSLWKWKSQKRKQSSWTQVGRETLEPAPMPLVPASVSPLSTFWWVVVCNFASLCKVMSQTLCFYFLVADCLLPQISMLF